MPRDGSGVYSSPPGTMAITNTPVPSTPYNSNVADVAQDLNTPRPIVAGGTGATTAKDAMLALGGEIASQVVTNYDSFAFQTGSFASAAGATSAPVAGGYFYGTAIVYDVNNTLLVARAMSGNGVPDGVVYVREKNGTWGPWLTVVSPNAVNTAKVNRAGDTMTGPLTVNSNATINGTLAVTNININGGLTVAGNAAIAGTLSAGDLYASRSATQGVLFLGSNSVNYLFNNGASFEFVGLPVHIDDASAGALVVGGGAQIGGAATVGGGLTVSGASISLAGHTFAQQSGPYYLFSTPTGEAALYLGGSGDPTNYYRNTNHSFAGIAGSPGMMTVDASGIHVTGAGTFSGAGNFTGNVTTAGYLMAGSGSDGICYFSNVGSRYIQYSGGQFNIIGGPIFTSSDLHAAGYLFADNGNLYLSGAPGIARATTYTNFYNDAGSICLTMGNATDPSNIYKNNTHSFQHSNGTQYLTVTYPTATFSPYMNCQIGSGVMGLAGMSGTTYQYHNNMLWDGTGFQMWVDTSNIGYASITCDYRAKQNVDALPNMWETVKALRPIRYTHKDFIPPKAFSDMRKHQEKVAAQTGDKARLEEIGPVIQGDDIERWGFVAHELQETLVPSAATGVKDDPVAIQSPNLLAVVAALTKALQEAMDRIENLEALVHA